MDFAELRRQMSQPGGPADDEQVRAFEAAGLRNIVEDAQRRAAERQAAWRRQAEFYGIDLNPPPKPWYTRWRRAAYWMWVGATKRPRRWIAQKVYAFHDDDYWHGP